MADLMRPLKALFAPESLSFQPSEMRVRRLSNMVGLYTDEQAVRALLATGNPVIYEMHVANVPEEQGHLLHSITVVYPGKIGDEYYMTSGHYHQDSKASEVYYCLVGEGILLVQSRDGSSEAIHMEPGTVTYIPPGWGHRTVNSGKGPFVFLGIWPGDAGHDYETIRKTGFAQLVIEEDGVPWLISNPKYRRED